jgi:ankyrin repeat protein
MQYLIDNKASIHFAGTNGFTPLMKAVVAGKHKVMQLLIDAKADLDVKDTVFEWNALHHAAFTQQTESARMLLEKRCQVNAVDTRRGDSALMLALVSGATDIADMLVRANADVNIRNKRSAKTYYHTFSKNTGKPKLVKRGDVAHDYARSDDMRRALEPDLDVELAAISKDKGLDPLFGSSFVTSNAKRGLSPQKLRAMGRSISPDLMRKEPGAEGAPDDAAGASTSPQPRRDRLSPVKAQDVARGSRTQIL